MEPKKHFLMASNFYYYYYYFVVGVVSKHVAIDETFVIVHQRIKAEQIVIESKVSWSRNVVVDNVRVTNIIDIVWRRETSELSAAASHELLLLLLLLLLLMMMMTNVHGVALMLILSMLTPRDDICIQWFRSETAIEEDVFPRLQVFRGGWLAMLLLNVSIMIRADWRFVESIAQAEELVRHGPIRSVLSHASFFRHGSTPSRGGSRFLCCFFFACLLRFEPFRSSL